jgi:hypothetical protein
MNLITFLSKLRHMRIRLRVLVKYTLGLGVCPDCGRLRLFCRHEGHIPF